jgi:hypothetical protein
MAMSASRQDRFEIDFWNCVCVNYTDMSEIMVHPTYKYSLDVELKMQLKSVYRMNWYANTSKTQKTCEGGIKMEHKKKVKLLL